MNKIFNPTRQNIANGLAVRGEVTISDYFRHLLITEGYVNNDEYRISRHTYKGRTYITVRTR